MKKLIDWLCNLGVDFYLHVLSVMLVATVIARLCFFLGAERFLASCIGVFLGLIAGFAKEWYDAKTTKIISEKDFIADLIGGIFFAIIFT